jgi:predicted nicotinamide N-methyase
MQLLEANVRDSGLSHVCSVQELPWGEGSWDKSLPAFDAVIAADVVYREDSAALLIQ